MATTSQTVPGCICCAPEATCLDCGSRNGDHNCAQGQINQTATFDRGSTCNGKLVKQETLYCSECVNCIYPDASWTPDPCDMPAGQEFQQTNSAGYAPRCENCVAGSNPDGSYPCAEKIRFMVGESPCSEEATCLDCGSRNGDHNCAQGQINQTATFDQGSTCNGKVVKQDTLYCSECVNCIYPEASWTPSTDTMPDGVEFQQTNSAGYAPKCGNCVAGSNPDGSYPCATKFRDAMGGGDCKSGSASISASIRARTSLGVTVSNERPYLTITSSGSIDLICEDYWNGGDSVQDGGTCTEKCKRPNAPFSAPGQLEIYVGGTLLASNSNYNNQTSLRGPVTVRIRDSGYYDNCGSYNVSAEVCRP